MKGTDFEFDLQRETPLDEPIWRLNPYKPSRIHIPEPKPYIPKRCPSWRFGIIGWYADENELAETLDDVYGKGNWRIAGRYLETFSEKHGWFAYYQVRCYTSGRYFLYGPHND